MQPCSLHTDWSLLFTYIHTCACTCVYVYVFVFDRQSDALECAWDNIRGEGSSLMVNKPTSDKFSLAFSSPPFHILILSRPCLTTSSHQRNDLFSSGWIFTSFGLAANFPFIRSARIVLPRRCFAVFISIPPPSLSLSLSLARSLARSPSFLTAWIDVLVKRRWLLEFFLRNVFLFFERNVRSWRELTPDTFHKPII